MGAHGGLWAKTKVHLASHANRCLESAEHLNEFTSMMNKVLGEVDNKDASELSSIFLLGTVGPVGVEFSQLELSVLNEYVKDFW